VRGAFGIFFVCVLGAACSDSSGGDDPGPPSGAPTIDLQLLSISDWHGQVDPGPDVEGTNEYFGGAAYLSTYFRRERAKKPNTLLFTAGDGFGATPPIVSLFEEKPAIEALNYLGLTADTFGNHNFDFGLQHLKDRVADSRFTWVTSNLNIEDGLGVLPNVKQGFHIVEVGEGEHRVKVGVVGVAALNFAELLAVGRAGPVVASEPIAAATGAAAAARAAGAHVVVALAHMGANAVDAEGKPAGPLVDFAKGLRGVDVLFGDHTDTIVNLTIGDALVIENRSRGRTYARVSLSIEGGRIRSKKAEIVDAPVVETAVLPASPCTSGTQCASGFCDDVRKTCVMSCPTTTCPDDFTCDAGRCRRPVVPDPEVEEKVLKKYREQLAQKLDTVVAVTASRFERNETIERSGETPIGDLVVDAMLDKYKPMGAQAAFINSGAIRSPLPTNYAPKSRALRRPLTGFMPGPPYDLVVGDAHTMLPLSNTCVLRRVRGETIWQMLENSVVDLPQTHGRFLAVAGIHFTYKLSGPPGARVVSVTLDDGSPGGVPIAQTDTNEYTIVIIDYLNDGGDFYLMLAGSPAPQLDGLAEVVAAYMQKQGGTLAPAPGSTDPNDSTGVTPCNPTQCPRIRQIP
jgi:5'-nucleotidase